VTSLVASSAETAIGGYSIHGVLGRGGMGVVYRATHPDRDEPVALKVIAPSAEWDENAQSRFELEIRAARAVSHRHILPVYDAGEADGRLFVAMKLAESGDLGTLLRHEGRLAPPRVIAILRQVASALDAAHAHGLVHRDVKPGNVLVEESAGWGNAYLADFGVTTVAFTGDAAAALTGTVGYSAPEQIRGETMDARGDVYALGCVLYECLTGHLPFECRDAMATLWAHLYDDAPAPSTLVADLPARLDAVMRRALAKDPRDRYASAGAFAEAAATSLAAEHDPETEEPEPESQLPIPPTTFVGRERELAEASAGLRLTRMLTVTGPGGAGKTRFALELAQREAAGYPDGVFACFLASLRDPSLVSTTVCQALGVQESSDQSALDALSAHLSDRQLLLLVDNVEHVREGLSDLEALLRRTTGLTVITTSRERLRFPGEAPYALPALGDDESVLLFCDRSGLDASETVEAICARLDGLPLALELAAARAETLTPEALLDLLSRRLDALAGDPEGDPRQETLRATIRWSYDLLSDDEKRLFAGLSVFVGGCTLEAAEEVCRASEESLQSLVDKSLLLFTDGRYSMLETIREFAAEQVSGDDTALEESHLTWLADTIYARRLRISRRDPDAFAFAFDELENIRSALTYAVKAGLTVPAQRLWTGAAYLWLVHGRLAEGDRWGMQVAAMPSERTELFGKALLVAGEFPRFMGELDRALQLKREGLAVLEALPPDDQEGQRSLAACHTDTADVLSRLSRLEEAEAHASRALAIRTQLGEAGGIAHALMGLAEVESRSGRHEQALVRYEEAQRMWTEAGSVENADWALASLGYERRALGDLAGARAALEDVLRRQSTDPAATTWDTAVLGLVVLDEGDFEKSVRLLAKANEEARLAGLSLDIAGEVEVAMARCRAELGEERFSEAAAAGVAAASPPTI
jgi:non-specific serine/threonine protein kinase